MDVLALSGSDAVVNMSIFGMSVLPVCPDFIDSLSREKVKTERFQVAIKITELTAWNKKNNGSKYCISFVEQSRSF